MNTNYSQFNFPDEFEVHMGCRSQPSESWNKNKTMKILKGKTANEIKEDFLIKYNINQKEFKLLLKNIKMAEHKKHLILLWTLPLILISATLFLSLAATLIDTNLQFPILYIKTSIFYEVCINVLFSILMIGFALFGIVFPSIRLDQHYSQYKKDKYSSRY